MADIVVEKPIVIVEKTIIYILDKYGNVIGEFEE